MDECGFGCWFFSFKSRLFGCSRLIGGTGSEGAQRTCRALTMRCDREQTALLQTALLHVGDKRGASMRAQIRTAQPGSIHSSRCRHDAAALGESSSPVAGLTCQCIFTSTSLEESLMTRGWRIERVRSCR